MFYSWGSTSVSDARNRAGEEDFAFWLSAALRNLFKPTSIMMLVKKAVNKVTRLKPNVLI